MLKLLLNSPFLVEKIYAIVAIKIVCVAISYFFCFKKSGSLFGHKNILIGFKYLYVHINT